MGCCYRIYFCALKLYFIPLIGHLAFCVLGFSDAALCRNERRIKGPVLVEQHPNHGYEECGQCNYV
jgi:hypothetical protein